MVKDNPTCDPTFSVYRVLFYFIFFFISFPHLPGMTLFIVSVGLVMLAALCSGILRLLTVGKSPPLHDGFLAVLLLKVFRLE